MSQAKDKQEFNERIVSVPSMSSDDANVNTGINTKDNDGPNVAKNATRL